MSVYRIVEIAGGVAAGILGIVIFAVALRGTEPHSLTFINILAGAFFYAGPSLLVTAGALIHAAKRNPQGRLLLIAGGLIQIGICLFFLLLPFPPSDEWFRFLMLAPGALVVTPMFFSLLEMSDSAPA